MLYWAEITPRSHPVRCADEWQACAVLAAVKNLEAPRERLFELLHPEVKLVSKVGVWEGQEAVQRKLEEWLPTAGSALAHIHLPVRESRVPSDAVCKVLSVPVSDPSAVTAELSVTIRSGLIIGLFHYSVWMDCHPFHQLHAVRATMHRLAAAGVIEAENVRCGTISNCPTPSKCVQDWGTLRKIEGQAERVCEQCKSRVRLTDGDAEEHQAWWDGMLAARRYQQPGYALAADGLQCGPPVKVCTKAWDDLAPAGGDPDERWCDRCTTRVLRVYSERDIQDATRMGRCVAIGFGQFEGRVGRPEARYSSNPASLEQDAS